MLVKCKNFVQRLGWNAHRRATMRCENCSAAFLDFWIWVIEVLERLFGEPPENKELHALVDAWCVMDQEYNEPLSVQDWLELPAAYPGEQDAKDWIKKYLQPVLTKRRSGDGSWLDTHILTVLWDGKRYRCSGASSMGDVWLQEDGSAHYYDYRVNVEELSGWEIRAC